MLTTAIVQSLKAFSRRRLSSLDVLALLLLALPFAAAVAAMIDTSVNIALNDDYAAIANFLYRYVEVSGPLHRFAWILTSQHNEYKLILLHAIVALQYGLSGHTNYRILQLLGDLSVPAIVGLLYLLVARQRRPFSQAVWLLLLPCYLFLSLSYWETINFAMSELATLIVIPIAIACVLLFTSFRPQMAFWGTVLLRCQHCDSRERLLFSLVR